MEKFKSTLVTILSLMFTMMGFIFVLYYIQNEMSILSFMIGILGFMITFLPAHEKWKEFFKEKL